MLNIRSSIEKFLTFPSISEQIGAKERFGRLILKDKRNEDYPLTELIAAEVKPTVKLRKTRKWRAYWAGNQRNTSMCTAFSALHYFEHAPVTHSRTRKSSKYYNQPYPVIDPRILYIHAQKRDPWPGESYIDEHGRMTSDYDGTSVLAMMQEMQARGFISEYYWENDNVDNVIQAVLNIGPVIIGSNWYRNMELRNRGNFIMEATGLLIGGHAYIIDEIDLRASRKGREVGIFNSWGKEWGHAGRGYMSIETLQKLIDEDGEICIATEVRD